MTERVAPLRKTPTPHGRARHAAQQVARQLKRPLLLGVLLGGFAGAWAAEGAGGITAQPFQPRSGPRTATMFTQMPSQQTGIVTSNPYDDPRMWAERFHEFGVGAIGTGVAVGDYD